MSNGRKKEPSLLVRPDVKSGKSSNQSLIFILSKIPLWFRRSSLRLYWVLTLFWNFFLFGILMIAFSGSGFQGLVIALICAIINAFIATLYVGPLHRLDEGLARLISRSQSLWWLMWIRLLFIVLPYWVYGWIPSKLLEVYFSRYLLVGDMKPQKATESNETQILCHSCGKELFGNPDFCLYCGAKLSLSGTDKR